MQMGKKIKYSIQNLLQQNYREIEKKVFNLIENEDINTIKTKDRFV